MRQPHINIIGIKHNEKAGKRIKTIQTQSKNIIHPHIMHKHITPNLFNGFIQRSDNERFFMQVSTIIRELKRMSTQTQITSRPTIWREKVIKGVSFGANLSKELIV